MAPHLGRRRLRRALGGVLIAATLALPVSFAADPAAVPAPAPQTLPPLENPSAAELAQRYADNRRAVRAAAETADAAGHDHRAEVLHDLAEPSRQFLLFDGRDGGRTAEVFGDLASAERVAVLVPGSDTSLDRYRRLHADAVALRSELGADSAVVAWLGYRTPATVSLRILTTDAGLEGAPALRDFVTDLAAIRPAASVSLLCHSYGSVVCGNAGDLAVDDIVLYGSPGVGLDSAAAMGTTATVWAGRGSADWVADIPHLRIPLLVTTIGLGTDPMAAEFGARIFAAGDAEHSGYLKPGSVSLTAIASIVSGESAPGRSDA